MTEKQQQRRSILLRVDQKIADELKKIADEKRRPINTEIIIAIEQYIDSERIEQEKTIAIQTAAQMTLDELCTEKIFIVLDKDGTEVQYKYSNFPGVYETDTVFPDLKVKKGYTVVTKEKYKKLTGTK